MNKFILSIIAVMAISVSVFANGPVNGPFISSADKTGFTKQSVGFQVDGNRLYVNYANDGKNLFALSKTGGPVVNVGSYAGGLLKGLNYCTVVTSNSKESHISYGFEKELVKFRTPVLGTRANLTGQVFPTGFGGAAVNSLKLSRDWAWGLRVGIDL
jgi:hypothetical protein